MTASKPSPRSRKDAAATAKASTDQAAAGPAQSPATTPAPPARKPSLKKANKRPEGQWAIDGHEPLNANEVVKAADDGLHVRPRIIDIYSKTGFDSIPEDDLQTRFRWWGLYTQRKPGLDGTANATMSDTERSDKYFLQRIRIDGMPQVNIHKYEFAAGKHTLLLPKGFLLVLGATGDKITARDAGLSGADKAIDWLFY